VKNRIRSDLGRKILATLMCVASLMISFPLLSEEPPTRLSNAVDAHGSKVIVGYARTSDLVIYAPRPQYPYAARSSHIEGSGLFRLTVDVNTGSVLKVTVVKSTRNRILDDAAVAAYRQWRFKPGKLTSADVPVTFRMGGRPRPLHPPGAKPTPSQR
jgi:TonB family protein